jgi:hypothetical protein
MALNKKCEIARCCGYRYHRFKADGGMLDCPHCGKLLEYKPGPGTSKPRTTVDRDIPLFGRAKTERINLGIELLMRHLRLGYCCTYDEIAAFCGCSNGRIMQIERRALIKLRKKMDGLNPFR